MRFAVADWDKPNHWKVLLSGGRALRLTRSEFLVWDWRAEGVDALVVESAHLKERNPFSVAQVYFEEELNAWVPSVPMYLFSAKVTKKARTEFRIDDKEEDTSAIAQYLQSLPEPLSALKRFYAPDKCPKRAGWDERNRIRKEACMQYNLFRTEKHGLGMKDLYELQPVEHCASLLEAAFDSLDEDVKDVFAIRKSRNGMRFDITPVMSAYCCAFDKDGEARAGSPAYIVKDIIGLHCFGVPNLIRANFMHFKIGPTDAAGRARITRSTRRLIAAFKLTATNIAVPPGTNKHVAVSPTKPYVPLGTKMNAGDKTSLVAKNDVLARDQEPCHQEGLLTKEDVLARDQQPCQEAAI